MYKFITLSIFCLLYFSGLSQNKYWVYLKDKANVSFNPYTYFDEKAIERRLKNNVDLYDISDYPLNHAYVEEIQLKVDSTGFQSRWFNAVVVWAKESQIQQIEALEFVKHTELMQLFPRLALKDKHSQYVNTKNENLRNKQINSFEGELFEPINIDGKSVRIAIFDAGFPSVDKQEAFAHIRNAKRIIGTYDFTKNKEKVYYSNSHGTMVLSNIAGIYREEKLGLATAAEFLLAKTEVASEPLAEEEYWLAAVEWADKNGADIINSSLGYTHHRYQREDMDGRSMVAKAGNMAFDKGILVVNSAGNEGSDKHWKYIGTPADASNVLTVGGISPETDYHISFSSYGPTADGRMKPNVSAMGHTLVISKNGLETAYGTSFSSPLVAGFAACVLQMNPKYTVKELFDEIQKSAHLYPYYDYAHGYGIPKASYFTHRKRQATMVSFIFEETDQNVNIKILENLPSKIGEKPYLYYHVSAKDGFLKDYGLIDVYQQKALVINKSLYQKTDVLRVYYKSYMKTLEF